MSGGRAARPPRPKVLRRRVREPATITLPAPHKPSPPPHPGGHAQVFVAALVVIILVGTALLASPWTTQSGQPTPVVDALFTAVSAVSVTGLVTVDTGTHWNRLGQVVILGLIQVGGLGFMVGTSIVLQAMRRGGARLSDVLLIREGSPTLTLREVTILSRQIVVFTAVVEAAGAAILSLQFWQVMPASEALWHGIFYAVAAFCNAGFDLQGEFASLIPYQDSVVINIAVIFLIQAGALSYLVLADVVRVRRWSSLRVDSKLVLLANAILVLVGMGVFLIVEWSGVLEQTPESLRPLTALFQSVTRTAGFATVNFADVQAVILFVWMALMFIGGASGSTAGGVKLATVAVVAMAIASTLQGNAETQVFRRRVPTRLVFQAMAVIAIMLTLHFLATVLLAASQNWAGGENFSFVALMFETMSALATVGLSTGITPSLTTAGKLILCVVMFVGRIGPLTAAYALQRRQQPTPLRFPVVTVRIG